MRMKHKVAAGVAGFGVAAWLREPSRRRRLRDAVAGMRGTVLPSPPVEPPPEPVGLAQQESDDAHAPGHRHLPPSPGVAPPAATQALRDETVVSHHPGHVHKG